MDGRYLTSHEVADRLGLSHSTILKYRHRPHMRFPAPDVMVGHMPGWLPATVDAWNDNRPRRSVK
jgi:predicted DNA-binding transcriptional regulator AlpA